ncbi:BZ3500_MvSof-1268-A1-R1_Chr10-1g02631 [Microbotryum saponariae]|uniref:BZ3500_MvSof-1268-A1-R1_Chr10-1g02631 protein n=1 Tax=Microbotryum saponariae TaxID=289078 RepID=A0A2X0LQG2_9BASI|nr:BZ3500_MvSof-1268-A1-R1_Chr10-1g02631 [Microbotryum saponariae]SDA06120.1 BZ3501_MvSof-1269-A2-R1_Chr10-1g02232 [Microbotryum saponariae]
MAQVQSYGSVTWVKLDSTKPHRKPRGLSLVKPVFTFGRLSSNDCRMAFETCSKVHAIITVDTDAPYEAVIGCSGVNGLFLNGRLINKGESANLNDGDLIVICDRTFKWGAATLIEVKIDLTLHSIIPSQTPVRPNLATSSPRLSLVWPCEEATPSSPKRAASLLSGLLSPFRSSAPASPIVQQSLAPTPFDLVHTDLAQWDEMDDEAGDLVTWEEEEEEIDEDGESLSEASLALQATPSLDQRARSRHSPMSADRRVNASPTARKERRLSMRMTIVPTDQAEEWIKERQQKLKLAQAKAEAEEEEWRPTSPTPSSNRVDAPTTPTRRSSSTSRRISTLLLSPVVGEVATTSLVPSDDEEANASDSDSSSDEIAEADEDVSLSFPLTPVASLATKVPLPATPTESSTSVPMIPRHLLTRRHSLREKVLIRSAIKSVITPPLTPSQSSGASSSSEETSSVESTPSQNGMGPDLSPAKMPRDSLDLVRGRNGSLVTPRRDSDDQDEEDDVEDDAMDVDEAEAEVGLASQSMITHSTPVQMTTVPRLIPTSAEARQAALVPLPETPSGSTYSYTPQAARPIFMPELQHAKTATPTPSPAPSASASASVARTPESTTSPNKFSGFVYHSTPTRSTPISSAPTFEFRPTFTPEMTSPINHHRVMATPKSALRPMVMSGRRKSIKGFLQAPPSTVKRRVVFNESVYVKEIVDIREPGLHWRAEDAEEEIVATSAVVKARVDPTTIPLPPSPTSPSTPLPAPISVRKAPLGGMTPSESMKAALAQLAPSGPVFGTPKTFSIGQSRRLGGLPSSTKASRLFASNGTPMRRAQRAGSTPGVGGSAIKIGSAVKVGSASLMPILGREEEGKVAPATTTSSSLALKQRMEDSRSHVNSSSSNGTPSVTETPYRPGSPIRFGEPLTAPKSTKPIPSTSKPTPAPTTEDDDLEFATPTRPAPGHQQAPSLVMGDPNPNHSTSLKRLFAPSAPSAITPKMNGLRMMFKTPASSSFSSMTTIGEGTGKTPGYEGLKELLLTPVPATEKSVSPALQKNFVVVEKAPEVIEVVQDVEAVEVVEPLIEEPVVEAIQEAQSVSPLEQAGTHSIETRSVEAAAEIAAPVMSDLVQAATPEPAVVVESSELEVVAAPIEEQQEDAVEEPTAPAAARKKATRTKRAPVGAVEAAVEAVEENPVLEPTAEEAVVERPARASRAKKAISTTTKKATTKRQLAVAAIVEEEAETSVVVEKKTIRGRGKKALEPEVQVEVLAPVEELAVVEEPKIETVKPKRATVSKKKAVSEVEVVAEENQPEPVPKSKPAARKGRTTRAAPLVFHEDEPEPTPEPVSVVAEPKVVRKARSRSALKHTEAMPQHQQEEEQEHLSVPVVAKTTRARKAAVVVDTENVAPVETKPKRRTAAVKPVEQAEEPTTTATRTRALRTRK